MDIDNRLYEARAKHELELKLAERRIELTRLKVEVNKAKELIKCQSQELVLLKHEHELMVLKYRLQLAQEDFKQAQAKHQLEIELPGRIEAFKIVKSSEIKSRTDRIVLDASAFKLRELARANLALSQSEALAESRGLKSIAHAWNEYISALMIDRLSDCLLRMIAKTFEVDPSFRLKLHRPLRLKSSRQVSDSEKRSYAPGNTAPCLPSEAPRGV